MSKKFHFKINEFQIFEFEFWHDVTFSNHNLNVIFSFRFSLNCYQIVTNIQEQPIWKWQQLGVKIFSRLCGMCLLHMWYYLIECCLLSGNWAHDECDDCIICTTNWFIQISLEFKEWLVYAGFVSKDTKLLVSLSWPSRKQSTICISSNPK